MKAKANKIKKEFWLLIFPTFSEMPADCTHALGQYFEASKLII